MGGKSKHQEALEAQLAAAQAQQAQIEADKKARPEDIKYTGVTNEDGTLKDIYKTQYTGDKYKDIAGQALGQNIKGARNTAAQQAMGAQANARSQLAQKGGIQGGMASRLAQTGMQQQMLNNQQIGSDQAKGITDINQKAFDVNAGAEKANLGLMTGDVANRQNFNSDQYKTKMSAWAATNLANQQQKYAPKEGKK